MIDVATFAEAAGSLSKVPIVDAAIAYDCPRTHQTYILIVRNALYVESMKENLIPPFIPREAGLIVNECPKATPSDRRCNQVGSCYGRC